MYRITAITMTKYKIEWQFLYVNSFPNTRSSSRNCTNRRAIQGKTGQVSVLWLVLMALSSLHNFVANNANSAKFHNPNLIRTPEIWKHKLFSDFKTYTWSLIRSCNPILHCLLNKQMITKWQFTKWATEIILAYHMSEVCKMDCWKCLVLHRLSGNHASNI